MKKYKSVIILIMVLLIMAVVSCTIIRDEIEIVDAITQDNYKVDPKGQLIVNAEIGKVSVEKTDRLVSEIDFYISKKWKSGSLMLQPKSKQWIKEMLKDLEIKIKRDPPDVRIDVKFKRGKQHWKQGLKWLTVNIQLKVPRQYKVVSNAVSK